MHLCKLWGQTGRKIRKNSLIMKNGIVFFHKNILNIYKKRWVEKCVSSILSQTRKDFSIYEINYGGDGDSLFSDCNLNGIKVSFFSQEMGNHAEAMNFIIDKAFEDGCDYVFNTNLDDYYAADRIEKQIELLEKGFDVVASDFCYITENEGEEDIVTFHKDILQFGPITKNLNNDHNVIAHPAVAISKRFWGGNRYIPSEIPREDLFLWKRAINNGYKFYIHPDELLFYRLHENQITGNNSPGGANKNNSDPSKGNLERINGSSIGTNLKGLQYNF